ncbi:tRNA modification GTPase TrmE [secondary endosymbiont of Heteropsylla cubana]|uniref:tRNA modification GTPase MnmE n=1 Tax=secondary endosymbiont of Heteropsylla cubana TaxID=134287 RepID=J3TGM2_9ENTR|nr:tRNA uridine-5-carboxymethylaminomethyl(34) synthesis GTPase MnmE [secondary endosymbiont of Heteropsylla cubana]AFP85617.1 tRNA modification GTPase TrmE [secondary endosymbiont of Heteropsylla cubana]
MNQTIIDTIVALATPPGRGGVGILRISGPLAAQIAYAVLGKLPHPRQAEYTPFLNKNGVTLDFGIAVFFPGPKSFTGEDVLELQGHGSPFILDLLMSYIVGISGVRIARPGEFLERAFLNKKLDLSQAEAIADLIDASSIQAARSAVNSLKGVFSQRIHELVEVITNLRIHIEAAIDFSDEKIDFLSYSNITTKLEEIIEKIKQVRSEARQGSLLREGMRVVIAGEPNVGKSSLLNALSGHDAAIVTPIPGTTRDLLNEYIDIDGMPLHVIDTAGLRDTNDEIECLGIDRAWREILKADHVLFMVDVTSVPMGDPSILFPQFIDRLPHKIPITIIRNKADLTNENIGFNKLFGYEFITISAKSGIGLKLLCEHLKKSVGFDGVTEGTFLARRRHIEALKTATIHLKKGNSIFIDIQNIEILAEELRLAQYSLSEITGVVSSNDLISKIFSNFCIGK